MGGRPVPKLVGRTFGRLTVIARDGSRKGHSAWLCRCACGVEKVVLAVNLIHGRTTSCGCYLAEQRGRTLRTHGRRGSREYGIWAGIKQRCLNPNGANYERYGARGISICDRWRDNFAAFLLDMGPCPPGCEIDRIDNDKGYEPGNCRWATRIEQANNKRRVRLLEYDGKSLSPGGWSRLTGLPRHVINGRVKLGWPMAKVLSEPIRAGRWLRR